MDIQNPIGNLQKADQSTYVKVWDFAIRAFHWTLVASFIFAYLTADKWDKLHEMSGYIIIGLIEFRLLWGMVGSSNAKFANFVKSPLTVVDYLRQIKQGKAKRYVGHNPAGGAMIVALLIALAIISATGFAMTTDFFWGVGWVEDLHEFSVNGTIVLIVIHIGGVIFASREHNENLIKAMITGRKRR